MIIIIIVHVLHICTFVCALHFNVPSRDRLNSPCLKIVISLQFFYVITGVWHSALLALLCTSLLHECT